MDRGGFNGYDIIGDVHGCGAELEALLDAMGYRSDADGLAHRHPSRQVIFVGDLIDRGPEQLRVLAVVKSMVDAGTARMVLGNHEFNALAYHTEHPLAPGRFLRPHDDPDDERSAKNEKQHSAFLKQVQGSERSTYLGWMWIQPLWLDLGGLRVVHACWHQPSIDLLTAELGSSHLSTVEQLRRASDPADPLYTAIETILKGPEISLTDHDQQAYLDKDKHKRTEARVRWWNSGATTLRELAEMDGKFTTADGKDYPELPDLTVPGGASHSYDGQVPVVYGHYWRQGTPTRDQDWTDRTACVDFSSVKGGRLTAYRWSGESRIEAGNYVSVGARASLRDS